MENVKNFIVYLIVTCIVSLTIIVIVTMINSRRAYNEGYKNACKDQIENNIVQKIDSVDNVIVDVKQKIDTVYINKTKIQTIYEQKIDKVNSLSDSSSVIFFKRYLSDRYGSGDTDMVYKTGEQGVCP